MCYCQTTNRRSPKRCYHSYCLPSTQDLTYDSRLQVLHQSISTIFQQQTLRLPSLYTLRLYSITNLSNCHLQCAWIQIIWKLGRSCSMAQPFLQARRFYDVSRLLRSFVILPFQAVVLSLAIHTMGPSNKTHSITLTPHMQVPFDLNWTITTTGEQSHRGPRRSCCM